MNKVLQASGEAQARAIGSNNREIAQAIRAVFKGSDEILLHAGGRVFVSSLGPGATGEQYAACTWLTIDGIEPFSNPWAIRESMPCLPVEQVLELVQDYDTRSVSRIKYIEERHCLMLQGQIAKIWQGFAK